MARLLRGAKGGEVSKQMTWAELVAWARKRAFVARTLQTTSGEELYQAYLGGPDWQIVTYCWYRSQADAQDALCRAVSAIREAK